MTLSVGCVSDSLETCPRLSALAPLPDRHSLRSSFPPEDPLQSRRLTLSGSKAAPGHCWAGRNTPGCVHMVGPCAGRVICKVQSSSPGFSPYLGWLCEGVSAVFLPSCLSQEVHACLGLCASVWVATYGLMHMEVQ